MRNYLWLLLLMIPFGLGCEAEAPVPSGQGQAIYGEDNRLEYYEALPTWQNIADDSILALMGNYELYLDDDGQYELTYPEYTLGATNNVCPSEDFVEQPTAAFCSGTLIAPDLVLTAGHCVEDSLSCSELILVFDYYLSGPETNKSIFPEDVYGCSEFLYVDYGPGERDSAIIRLDRPVVGRTPATIATTTAPANESLTVLGFPDGIPMKISGSGAIISTTSKRYYASLDTFHGNSGSGVFNEDGHLQGVLTTGQADYVLEGVCYVVAEYPTSQGSEGVQKIRPVMDNFCATTGSQEVICGGDGPPEQGSNDCGNGICDISESTQTCPADCPVSTIPQDWSCPDSFYGAGDGCDCGCSVEDPDCSDPLQNLYGCGDGQICEAGICTTPDSEEPNEGTNQDPPTTIPSTWTCSDAYYGTDDGCDCQCGAIDPDCIDPTATIYGCDDDELCVDDTCVDPSSEEPTPPETEGSSEWLCDASLLGDGSFCDCNCGAPDPDCTHDDNVLRNCPPPANACSEDGLCIHTVEPESDALLTDWTCRREQYGSGDGCHCECGLFDPDCADRRQKVVGCERTQICSTGGTCVDDLGRQLRDEGRIYSPNGLDSLETTEEDTAQVQKASKSGCSSSPNDSVLSLAFGLLWVRQKRRST